MSPSDTHYPKRFKIFAILAFAVALSLFIFAYLRATADDDDPTLENGDGRRYVEELIPGKGSQTMQQGTIGIDLVAGWQGVLVINGQEVPEDQLASDQGLNRIEFAPGPGKMLETLPTGQLCVQALVWEAATGREGGQRTVSWCFEVV